MVLIRIIEFNTILEDSENLNLKQKIYDINVLSPSEDIVTDE